MARRQASLTIIALLAGSQLAPRAELHAQRPVASRDAIIAAPSIMRPVETNGAYQSAAARFRSSVSLVVVGLPTTNRTGLKGLQVTWAPHPGAARYRLLRGATAASFAGKRLPAAG